MMAARWQVQELRRVTTTPTHRRGLGEWITVLPLLVSYCLFPDESPFHRVGPAEDTPFGLRRQMLGTRPLRVVCVTSDWATTTAGSPRGLALVPLRTIRVRSDLPPC